ncbi:MAG: hypothetical protein F4164_02900 [Gemmatimonadales bacterium]|nr:hypothetical protein [Gemmatimonadales bacterium]MYG48325.1 hypothetical protein [Gemmatimonadales bacterium]MYK01577.1 hypothetical protein [Candidatus Palauibacter ramosifaciens]
MATVLSRSGLGADVDSLPAWRKVIEGMAEPGCGFHFRRVAGAYAPKEYWLAYSGKATAKAEAWKALVYNVLVTVSRPAEGGGTEVLPERLAIRAVCAMPDTKDGTDEAMGRVEAILKEHGIEFPGADKSEARAPAEEEGRWALAALRWAGTRLGPRPLRAAQDQHGCADYEDARQCPMEDVEVTIHRPVRCSAGFDYEATTGECVSNTLGGGPTTGGSGNSGTSGGGTSTPPTPPSEPECTDDQIAIAAEYNDPAAWPCTNFVDAVTPGTGTHGHTTGYLTVGFVSGSSVVLSEVAAAGVSGAFITSDWRCPTGNAAVGGVPGSTHVAGRAGDFTAPGFDEDMHDDFLAAANSADASWISPYGGSGYTGHIHIHW